MLDNNSKVGSFADNKENSFPQYNWNDKNLSIFLFDYEYKINLKDEYEKLMREKQYLLETGEYSQDDPLIMALEKEIQNFKKKN